MDQTRTTIALVLAILYQWIARSVAEPLALADLPLIVVVYTALQGNTIRALLFATISGIAVDALSGGLLGASGFSKTLVAYLISEIARRVYLENILLKLLTLAGASALSVLIYYLSHRLLGQAFSDEVFNFLPYMVFMTLIAGLPVFLILDNLTIEKLREARKTDFFSSRRQARRRNPIRLGRKV
ncbi:MAG: rod shape-determining protein MreD [Pyrinomonadaceae bacterium]|nr:rod shape-determining protein MreD [Pyrinomonadaceae bacterium]MCX7638870.1 rod shape-determining protein MreD [Pyrinomonadaceae bacterium]MDW8304994.1 rod shape-determining protein MreD [Acidobacteriota bacterium]